MIKQNLNNLKEIDLYSVALWSLYKLVPVPEYSSLAELSYVLDKENLLNLCEYYGGQTVKIPTLEELAQLMKALTAAHLTKTEGISYEEASSRLGVCGAQFRNTYLKIKEVLDGYEFKSRDPY